MRRRFKASPFRGGGSAQPGRRGRAGKRQPLSRLRRQLPCKGSLWCGVSWCLPLSGEGGTAVAVTDEVEALLSARRCPPHQSPSATASPHRGSHPLRRANLSGASRQLPLTRGALVPRKKVKRIIVSTAPSIDGNRSEATSIKFDAPVSGGAQYDTRKVTPEWNDA